MNSLSFSAVFFCLAAVFFVLFVVFKRKSVKAFLKRNGFASKMITDDIMYDFTLPKPKACGCDMSETYLMPPEKTPCSQSVIVIDAGGTNFRSCLVSFDEKGKAEISDYNKTSMPALDREYSKEEFFSAIADRIEYLRDKADRIGFCFSYSLDMTKDGDAVPNAFSKEIKAQSVIGVPVGKNLKDELEKRGWRPLKKITVVNDTVSALMAGKTCGTDFDSYIGFILGTGMNAAFITQGGMFADEQQIIVCESGKCCTFKLSRFDLDADNRTAVPGSFPLEKCCSGAYLGNTVQSMLNFAGREGLFSNRANKAFAFLKELTTVQADDFLHSYAQDKDCSKDNPVAECCFSKSDLKTAFKIIDSAADRCAHYAASVLSACALASAKGKNPEKPLCIVLNGTTLFKTWKLKERIEKYLYDYLTQKRKIYFKTVTVENDIILGTAAAGLI